MTSDLAAIAAAVREASREGKLTPLSQVWTGPEDEFAPIEDIACIREGVNCYLYSSGLMTRQYAETVARIAAGDVGRLIAGAVRFDSSTYPRPTPVEVFLAPPYNMSSDQVAEALEQLPADPECADICRVTASDGSVFLYSTRHLQPEHARSLAERIAVRHYENP
jgi:hypothetical protein